VAWTVSNDDSDQEQERPMAVSEDTRAQMRDVVALYPRKRSALMPLLHLVQADEGAVTPAGIAEVAALVELTEAEVSAVATFYTMYLKRKSGEYRVGVCINSLCAVLGGDEIWRTLTDHCGVGNNETTDDGKITLERIECQAACTHAPVMTANWEFLDDMTVGKATETVDQLRAGHTVRSTRGPQIRTFREAERTISGVDDGLTSDGDHRDDRTLAGLTLAKHNGDFETSERAQRAAADAVKGS
jgi:NADH-quinone oxidoreductase subunit E